jgi:hypothetical protein
MVRLGKTFSVCGTKPTPLRTSAWALRPVMSSPRSTTVPERIVTRPNIALSSVDLPGAVRADDADQLAVADVESQPLRMLTPGT